MTHPVVLVCSGDMSMCEMTGD